ncbi:sushi, von Willebrand factor type A, EGF and pentraxin domain-containing protein 1-like [Tubulanus polymorphus]|uniref:sushi, von Willebrand factor type A, EGF and pentraxin domain-containing protein 1-like n=1 Tax=Tubulanus polymorphus TaxID=672921 RepID=UPI003DA62A91
MDSNAPKNARVQFTLHELELEGSAGSCHDYLEVKAHALGQIGKRYCGKTADAFKTITSSKNHMMLVLKSDYGATKKGFSGTASIITEDQFCYNVEDRGESYRGNISYTQSFVECLPWEEMTHCEFHPFIRRGYNAGLEGHNHCRNPGGTTVKPWCYTQKEMCKQDMCDVCQFTPCHDLSTSCVQTTDFCESVTGKTECRKTCQLCQEASPLIQDVRCKPAVLSKGVIQKDSVQAEYRVGDVVLFGCDEGGTEHFTRMCQSDGTWSGDDIRCIGCLPGSVEVNGYCVYVSDEAASFNGAIIECNKFGYELASVPDEIFQNDLLDQIINNGRSNAWVGLSLSGGSWGWSDGSALDFTSWSKYGSAPTDTSASCMYLKVDKHRWWTDRCDSTKHFICTGKVSDSSRCVDAFHDCLGVIKRNPSICENSPLFAKAKCRQSCGVCRPEVPATSASGCGLNAKPENVIVTTGSDQETMFPGEAIKYECMDGFELVTSDTTRRCLSDGEYAGSVPMCIESKLAKATAGRPVIDRRYIDPSYRTLIIDAKVTLPKNGKVVQWDVFGALSGTVAVQIWRIVDAANGKFQFIGQNEIETEVERFITKHIPANERIVAQANDVIGFQYISGDRSMTYDSCAKDKNYAGAIYENRSPGTANIGDTVTLTLQAKTCRNYSIQATVEPILSSCSGVNVEGATVSNPAPVYPHGYRIDITCNSGYYKISGDDQLTCDDGTWLGDLPNCETVNTDCPFCKISCGMPESTKVAKLTSALSSSISEGDTITYQCPAYHKKVSGNENRICQSDGKLSGNPLVCTPITECIPDTVENAVLINQKSKYNLYEVAEYACTAGSIKASGSLIRTCGYKGLWIENRPVCMGGGEVNDFYRTSRSGVEYTGNISVTIDGRPCQRWDSDKPHKHWYHDLSKYPDSSWDAAANHCRNPDVEPNPWCYTDTWKRWNWCDIPFAASSCGPPPAGTNVRIQNSEFLFTPGHSVFYKCREGSVHVSGDMQLECVQDNDGTLRYVGEPPICTDACTSPPTIENAHTDAEGAVLPGESIQYRCDDTFYLVAGNTQVSCSAEAKWVTNNLPVCKDASQAVNYCKLRVKGIGYRGTKSETFGLKCQRWSSTYPHKHKYTYVKGHYCRNPSTRAKKPWCYINHRRIRWLYCNIPFCQSSCGDPEGGVGVTRIDANPLIFHDGKERAVVTYKCSSSDSVLLSGDLQRICQADGTFSGSAPVCGVVEA